MNSIKSNLSCYVDFFSKFCLLFTMILYGPKMVFADDLMVREEIAMWDPNNDPKLLGLPNLEFRLAQLPLSGKTQSKAWADSYWPSFNQSIAYRWQSLLIYPNNSPLFGLQEIASMTPSERNENLSPSEKLDVLRGDNSYKLTNAVRGQSDLGDVSWSGICHGWAQAALAYPEPKPKLLKSTSGLEILFTSSDIKALLSYWMGEASYSTTRIVGKRCDDSSSSSTNCQDMDAGAFHVAMANLLGKRSKGFVADFDEARPIWNFPVHAYSSRILNKQGSYAEVETTIYHPKLSRPYPAPFLTNPNFYEEEAVSYRYSLELNAVGEIVGGKWLQDSHPDFLWTQEMVPFRGIFESLNLLVAP